MTFRNSHEAIEIDFSDATASKSGKPVSKTTLRNRINKALKAAIPTYCEDIPLSAIFEIVKRHGGLVVDEAGQPWEGLLCGETGYTNMKIDGLEMYLYLSWYKMPSGRWEIVTYVS